MNTGIRLILTGLNGSGKSALCQRIVQHAKHNEVDIQGLISPAVMEAGRKIGIDMVDLGTGQRLRLATQRRGNASGGLVTRRWVFDPEVMARGNAILEGITHCELLVIDELGPLEFERGEGWLAGLTAVDQGRYQAALVVVRPDLVAAALERWPDAGQIEIQTPNQIAELTQEVLQRLGLIG